MRLAWTLARLQGSYPASARLFSVAFPNYTNESCREPDRQHDPDWRPMLLFQPSPTPCGTRAKLYSKSVYAYYRDSERLPMVAIRTLLEQWFAEVPASEQLDLAQRLRSPILRQHRSAFFELYLHHLLVRKES